MRVFYDRLVTDTDREYVSNLINSLVKEAFPEEFEYVSQDPILFGDFRHAMQETPRLYEDLLGIFNFILTL